MTKQQLIEDDDSCLNRSSDDEPVFLLCARDRTAPDTITDWIQRAELLGTPKAKLEDAERVADEMRAWQERNGYKVPD